VIQKIILCAYVHSIKLIVQIYVKFVTTTSDFHLWFLSNISHNFLFSNKIRSRFFISPKT